MLGTNYAFKFNMAPFFKILWAVDPYDEPSRLQAPKKLVKYVAEASSSTVQPVYIVSTTNPVESELDSDDKKPIDLSPDQKITDQLFKEIYLKNLLHPQVIQAFSNQPNRIVDTLISYAQNIDADLILTNTHSRGILSRIFQGSFSNRLLLRSPIPVLALGPKVETIIPFDRILYATHLDPNSKFDFRYSVKIAEIFHSQLTVLHLLSRHQRDQEGNASTAVGQSLPPRSHLKRRARAWSNWASRKGVETDIVFQDSFMQTTQQIMQMANRHRVGLILLESRSERSISLLKGSKVREMIRNSRCPVWVQRTPKKSVIHGTGSHTERSAA
jgi:nucleotide-binding universal stress UspA family protein